MAKIMNDEQRLAILESYNPQEHLISIGTNKDRSPVLYYPAAWRLYELRLRHPHFTLEAEIIHMDVEKGTVIVKAIGYDGADYASSTLKGTAMKQGKLSELDKVETKAKSRVARDVGIGTEYALDMDPDETDATHDAIPEIRNGRQQNNTSPAHNTPRSNPDSRQPAKSNTPNTQQAPAKNRIVAGNALAPSDIDTLKSEWATVYAIPDERIETRWPKYLRYLLEISEPDLKTYHKAVIKRDLDRQKEQAKVSVTQVASVAPEVQQSA